MTCLLLCHNPYDQPQIRGNSEDSAIMAPLFVCHYNNIHSSAAVGSAEQIRAYFFTRDWHVWEKQQRKDTLAEGKLGKVDTFTLSPFHWITGQFCSKGVFFLLHCNKELVICQAFLHCDILLAFPLLLNCDNTQICSLQLCVFFPSCFCKHLLLSSRFPLELWC